MGRATEYFDYLNCDPEDLKDHQDQHWSFTPNSEDKKTRRTNLARLRKEKLAKDVEDDIIKLF